MSERTPAENAAAREAIMARVREALRVPAPPPHASTHAAGPAGRPGELPILPVEAARPWLPDGGDGLEASLAILEENLGRLRAVVFRVPDLSAAADCLSAQARQRDWRQVAWHGDALVEQVLSGVPCASFRVDAPGVAFDKNALEACDAGLTGCECLVAQTGSILVSSVQGGRALSILPHCHVVIATVDQVVPALDDAFAVVRHRHPDRPPSMLSFITGPSRTGDIERILVLGAHGPKELLLLLVG